MESHRHVIVELRSIIASLNKVITMLEDPSVRGHKPKSSSHYTGTNLSVPEAAKYMGVSQRTIRKLISERQIAHTRIGRRVLIPLSSIEEFLAKKAVPVFDAKAFAKEILEGRSSRRKRTL